MPSTRPPVETQIGAHRWSLRYFTPSEALPLFGRLTAFLGPALEGAAGEVIRALLAAMDDPDQDLRELALKLSKSANVGDLIAGVFRVRWGDPVFMGLVRELLAPVNVYDGQVPVPVVGLLDSDMFAGPEGLQELLQAIGWTARRQFGLPLFSLASGATSPSASESASEPSATAPPPAPGARAIDLRPPRKRF